MSPERTPLRASAFDRDRRAALMHHVFCAMGERLGIGFDDATTDSGAPIGTRRRFHLSEDGSGPPRRRSLSRGCSAGGTSIVHTPARRSRHPRHGRHAHRHVFVANISRHGTIAEIGWATSCCALDSVANIGTRDVRVTIRPAQVVRQRTLALRPPGLMSATKAPVAEPPG